MTIETEQLSESDYRVVIRPQRTKYWSTTGLKIMMNADRFARVIGSRMVKHLVHSIKLNLKPQGGPQKPMDTTGGSGRQAAQGKRPRARGLTDRAIFVNSIRLKKIRATKLQANYEIAADPFFDEWLVDERNRGVDYYEPTGNMKRLIEDACADIMNRLARRGK